MDILELNIDGLLVATEKFCQKISQEMVGLSKMSCSTYGLLIALLCVLNG